MKDIGHKRSHSIRFHLYKILETAKCQWQKADCQESVAGGGDWLQRDMRVFGGMMEIFYCLIAEVVTGLCTFVKIHWTVHWKWANFVILEINLTKCTNLHEENYKAMQKIWQRWLIPSKYSTFSLTHPHRHIAASFAVTLWPSGNIVHERKWNVSALEKSCS